MSEIKVIPKAPIIVNGFEREPENGHIWGFKIGSKGVISFHPEEVNLPLRNVLIPTMVSLGMTNTAIARKLRRGETAIKNSLIRDFTLLGITPRRRGIARAFFDRGIYQIEEFGDSLDLTASEFQIIDNLSQGKTDKEAAENITESTDKKISETTIRNHLTHIGKRTGWHGMEATLAAIVSGDVGNYALRGEVEDPSVAAQEVPIPATRKPLSFMEYESGTI